MLYDIGFFIFSLFYLPALLFRGKLHGDFLQRFGVYDEDTRKALGLAGDKIWIQAVSVGEVALCKALIPLLKSGFPENKIVLSTITKTGNDLARRLFSKDATVIYFPLDFSGVAGKVARLIRPKIYIMIETEIWPNLLRELKSVSVPTVILNGRISDKSFGKYRLAKHFMRNILADIDRFCMRSSLDAERVMELGAPPDKVKVTGNMKFDAETPMSGKSIGDIKRWLKLGESDELLVAGSTHKGEEEIILSVFKNLIQEFPKLKLFIAPRHIERVNDVEIAIRKTGMRSIRVSQACSKLQAPSSQPIFILDTIGQLNDIYSVATLVFVGGSLVKHGGQSPVEPALFAKPVLFGPHMFNFKDIASAFLKNKAALEVADEDSLLDSCRSLLRDANKRAELGRNAKETVSRNRGATRANLEEIRKLVARSS